MDKTAVSWHNVRKDITNRALKAKARKGEAMQIYYGDQRDSKNLESCAFLQINSCGSNTTLETEYLVIRSGRCDYHLLYVTEGEVEIFHADGTVSRLACGDFMLYPPHTSQKYKRLRGARDLWVHFNGFQVPQILREAMLPFGMGKAPAGTKTKALLLSLITAHSTESTEEKGFLLTALYSLGNRLAGKPLFKQDDPIQQAVLYINENYEKEFSNTFLSNMCNLSHGRFEHLFKAEMGVSPSAYRQRLRIENASSLLSSTTLPVSDIAILCGFSDPLYFSRIFKRKVGCSPTEYRRNCTAPTQNGFFARVIDN